MFCLPAGGLRIFALEFQPETQGYIGCCSRREANNEIASTGVSRPLACHFWKQKHVNYKEDYFRELLEGASKETLQQRGNGLSKSAASPSDRCCYTNTDLLTPSQCRCSPLSSSAWKKWWIKPMLLFFIICNRLQDCVFFMRKRRVTWCIRWDQSVCYSVPSWL